MVFRKMEVSRYQTDMSAATVAFLVGSLLVVALQSSAGPALANRDDQFLDFDLVYGSPRSISR
jgi:hypothetical protein